jgi:hypothetical protein
MKSGLTPVVLAALGLAFHPAAMAAKAQRKITCPLPSGESLTFVAPAKLGELPKIDLDYPSKVTLFSFRDGNFLAVAMDEAEPSRLRLVISAQLNKAKGSYDGQIVIDEGGNELQLSNAPVSCKAGS